MVQFLTDKRQRQYVICYVVEYKFMRPMEQGKFNLSKVALLKVDLASWE